MIKNLLLGMLILLSLDLTAQLSKQEKKLVSYVDRENAQALVLLKELVNINSGTMNFDGVKQVGMRLISEFEKLGMEVAWVDGSSFGRAGHVHAKMEGGKGKKILLIGHLDTVFELNSPFQEWTPLAGDTVRAPGVADMKGGDVIILQSLRALHSQGLLKDMNISVVMTGDEEDSGTPLSESKKLLIDEAKWADVTLGFENGDGNYRTVNVARRSSSGWKLTVIGRPAHSSQIFKPEVGAGAIYEVARILSSFYDELSQEKFLTFNPGYILGGTEVINEDDGMSGSAFGKQNVVAQNATVKGDLRCISQEQREEAVRKMQQIVDQSLPETSATIEFDEGYPPFAPTDGNYELMRQFSEISQELGFGEVGPVNPSDAGAADISFTSEYVERGIDGLGMSGKYDHTVNEEGYLSALPLQTKRTAVLLYRLTR